MVSRQIWIENVWHILRIHSKCGTSVIDRCVLMFRFVTDTLLPPYLNNKINEKYGRYIKFYKYGSCFNILVNTIKQISDYFRDRYEHNFDHVKWNKKQGINKARILWAPWWYQSPQLPNRHHLCIEMTCFSLSVSSYTIYNPLWTRLRLSCLSEILLLRTEGCIRSIVSLGQ